MNESFYKPAAGSLVIAALLCCLPGCAKKVSDAPPPQQLLSYSQDTLTFIGDIEKVKVAFKDKIAVPYGKGVQISKQYMNPSVPVKDRKMHSQELIALMQGVSKEVPEMQKQIEAVKTPANAVEAKQHFLAHLAAMKKETEAYCVYADLASKSADPGKNPKFVDSVHAMDDALNTEQQEMQKFQQSVRSLALNSPSPTP